MEFHDAIYYDKFSNFVRNAHGFLANPLLVPDTVISCYLKASFETDFEDICNHFNNNEDEDMMKVIEEMKTLKDDYLELMEEGWYVTNSGCYCWNDYGDKCKKFIRALEEPLNNFIKIVSSELMKRKNSSGKRVEGNLQETEKTEKRMESEPSSKIEKANSKANVIVRDCNNLYENKYSIAKEELAKNGWNEKVVEEWLLKIFMECFKETKERAEISKTKVKDSFKDQLLQHPFSKDEKEFPHQIEISICQMLQEKPDPSILENLSQKIFVRYADKLEQANTSKSFKDFIDEAVHVTWQMNTCNPPMCLSTAGKIFDDSKHICMGGHGNSIERYLWPCIYMCERECENGEVLQRGYVVKGDCSVHEPEEAIEPEA